VRAALLYSRRGMPIVRLVPLRWVLCTALLACLPFPGCISSARYQEAIAERDRLARENLELQRSLVEQKVRAAEAAEAAGLTTRPAAQAPAPSVPGPAETPSQESTASLPLGLTSSPAAIADEDIRDAVPGGADTGSAEGILKVARAYASSRRTREAMDAYTRLITDYPFSPLLPVAFLERGRLRLTSGDRAGALEDFDTIAEAFPASPQAGEARRQGNLLRH